MKKYRQEIHALAGVNFLVAVVNVGASYFLTQARDVAPAERTVIMVITSAVATIMIVLGVCLILKQGWAIIGSMAIYCLILINAVLAMNLCGSILMGACLFQGARVWKAHGELKKLDPEEIAETFD